MVLLLFPYMFIIQDMENKALYFSLAVPNWYRSIYRLKKLKVTGTGA